MTGYTQVWERDFNLKDATSGSLLVRREEERLCADRFS